MAANWPRIWLSSMKAATEKRLNRKLEIRRQSRENRRASFDQKLQWTIDARRDGFAWSDEGIELNGRRNWRKNGRRNSPSSRRWRTTRSPSQRPKGDQKAVVLEPLLDESWEPYCLIMFSPILCNKIWKIFWKKYILLFSFRRPAWVPV